MLDSTKKLCSAHGGNGSPVRIGLLAGADRRLSAPERLGMDRAAWWAWRGVLCWSSLVQTLQRHPLLREEVRS